MLTGLIVAIVLSCMTIAYALLRPPPRFEARFSKTRETVIISLLLPEAFARLDTATLGRWRRTRADAAGNRLMFEDNMSLSTWGSYYLVELTGAGTETAASLGIKSKVFQKGPLMTRALKAFATEIRAVTGTT